MLTLGIDHSHMYDSSPCLVHDGELRFAVAEERMRRVRHDAHFLSPAIQAT
jgi:carbamoyltransferase